MRLVSRWMRTIRSCVRSRVEPPAPYVTETNEGCSTWSWAITSKRSSDAASVLGGKNSKLNVVGWFWKMSRMCIEGLLGLSSSADRRSCSTVDWSQDNRPRSRMGERLPQTQNGSGQRWQAVTRADVLVSEAGKRDNVGARASQVDRP